MARLVLGELPRIDLNVVVMGDRNRCGDDETRDDDAGHEPDVAEDQASQRHAVTLLAALPDLAARDVAHDDRGNAGQQPEEDLADAADQRGNGQGIGRGVASYRVAATVAAAAVGPYLRG